jgi:O-antigen/teichoic acid export membrane protein
VQGLSRPFVTPERLYLMALALTGGAALVSVALPPAERGELVAAVASATLGAAVGGFSVDTFLLSRPSGWVYDRGWQAALGMLVACVALSGVAAAVLIAVAALGSYAVGVGAACGLTVFNAVGSLAMRRKGFLLVYAIRAAGGAALVLGYAALYLRGRLDGLAWSAMWLAVQVAAAAVLCVAVLLRTRRRWPPARRGVPSDLRSDLAAVGRLHTGVCAQMVTYRIDQILVARFAGAGPLGVYALAVAALEFAQAGAVVRAQRILARRERDDVPDRIAATARSTVPIALASVAGLAALALVRPEYRQAWLLGLILVPGAVAVAAGKTWSAVLLRRRGEQATTVVALLTMAVAVLLYLALIPWLGAWGAAFASTCAYLVYAGSTRRGLRRAGRPLALREP